MLIQAKPQYIGSPYSLPPVPSVHSAKNLAAADAAAVEVYHDNISYTNDSENDVDNDNNEQQIYKVFEYDENDKGIFEVNIDFDDYNQ